ncbi:MAG TPA: four helix bundle suffix domain-containing protein [Kiritimatiellia bacterium]|mgnify:CR=1 FL=1|nr:four helix bundle suffix domain-containing protein [Kiritimatiellia bacterium]
MDKEPLIPLHGGYRKLKSFQVAQLAYDVTVRFVERYVDRFSRTRDQMVQAARSGVQNIAEGSQASGTSKKTELKLTNVARASLEELKLDYEDFLRQRGLARWSETDPRAKSLVAARCQSADEVAAWVVRVRKDYGQEGREGGDGPNGQNRPGKSTKSMTSMNAEISANAALVLIGVACALLSRQIETLARQFEAEGGFTERLYRVRQQRRNEPKAGKTKP